MKLHRRTICSFPSHLSPFILSKFSLALICLTILFTKLYGIGLSNRKTCRGRKLGFNMHMSRERSRLLPRSALGKVQPVSEKPSGNISKFYSALGNPYRRQIVQLLREKRKLGFKELHEALKISVGALYHHLDMLEGIVAQGPDRKYVLTDRGRSTVETLSISEEKIAAGHVQSGKETRLGFFSGEILLGRTLLNYLNADPIRSLPLAILIVAFGGWISSQTRLEPLLLFYLSPSSGTVSALFLLMFP